MRNHLIILLLGLIISLSGEAQYLKIPEIVFDKVSINHIVDSLESKRELDEYIIYQKEKSVDTVLSYLVCRCKKVDKLWVLYDDHVNEFKILNSNSIFSYKNLFKTGATNREDVLKFRPPILSVIHSEVVVYYNTKAKIRFYFEFGTNTTTYEPNPESDKYRKKWLDIINTSITK